MIKIVSSYCGLPIINSLNYFESLLSKSLREASGSAEEIDYC